LWLRRSTFHRIFVETKTFSMASRNLNPSKRSEIRTPTKAHYMHLTLVVSDETRPHATSRFSYIELSPRKGDGWPLHHAMKANGYEPRNYQPGNRVTCELYTTTGCDLSEIILDTQDVRWPEFLEFIGDIPSTGKPIEQ
jgi:hypothetical protein